MRQRMKKLIAAVTGLLLLAGPAAGQTDSAPPDFYSLQIDYGFWITSHPIQISDPTVQPFRRLTIRSDSNLICDNDIYDNDRCNIIGMTPHTFEDDPDFNYEGLDGADTDPSVYITRYRIIKNNRHACQGRGSDIAGWYNVTWKSRLADEVTRLIDDLSRSIGREVDTYKGHIIFSDGLSATDWERCLHLGELRQDCKDGPSNVFLVDVHKTVCAEIDRWVKAQKQTVRTAEIAGGLQYGYRNGNLYARTVPELRGDIAPYFTPWGEWELVDTTIREENNE